MSSAVPVSAHMAPVRVSAGGIAGTADATYWPVFVSNILGRISSSADLPGENFSGQPKYAVPP